MADIQFGFIMPGDSLKRDHHTTFVDDLNHALTLIEGHFDSAWMIDHLQFGDKDVLEGFTTLTYMAALHPKLKFGHTMLCQSFRNPALVAKMGATLQFLSGGRYILGMGAGWHEEEYRAYGYDFPSDGVRVEQLEEAVQIVRRLWVDERTIFEGQYYRVIDAYCEPKPVPIPPIMIGAFRPRMLRLTARYADAWNVSSTSIQKYRRLSEAFEHACAEVGRDPQTVQRSWGGGCICAHTQAEAEAIAENLHNPHNTDDDFDFMGTPSQIIDQMRPLIDLGITTFMLDCGGFPDLTTLELLSSEVLPALNG